MAATERRASLGIRVETVSVAGNEARVTLEQPVVDGTKASGAARTVREGGRWKIAALPARFTVGQDLVYRVPSDSMAPTLHIGEQLLIDPTVYARHSPAVGDVIVFHPPRDAQSEVCGAAPPAAAVCGSAEAQPSDQLFIKRIAAGPGDVILMKGGQVYRNGRAENDTYIRRCASGDSNCNFPTPVRIPADHWFMLGDNRGQSDDSRFWGPVPTSWIVGKVSRVIG